MAILGFTKVQKPIKIRNRYQEYEFLGYENVVNLGMPDTHLILQKMKPSTFTIVSWKTKKGNLMHGTYFKD